MQLQVQNYTTNMSIQPGFGSLILVGFSGSTSVLFKMHKVSLNMEFKHWVNSNDWKLHAEINLMVQSFSNSFIHWVHKILMRPSLIAKFTLPDRCIKGKVYASLHSEHKVPTKYHLYNYVNTLIIFLVLHVSYLF